MIPLVLLVLASPRIDALQRQLKLATRPAARVAAARALGQSDRPAVLGALCGGLADVDPAVRAASAQALEALAEPDALDCLKRHEADAVGVVHAAILQAETTLRAAQARPPRFYVLLGATHANPKDPALASEAAAALRRHLRERGASFAPDGESPKRARAFLARHRGWASLSIHPELTFSDGALGMTLVCARYPEGRLLGEVSAKARGAAPDDLVHALIPKLLAEATQTCGLP